MTEVNKLLDKAKEVCRLTSDASLSRHLNLSRSAVANWRSGVSHPDAIACAKLAEITGFPLARVIGMVGEARAISREEKAVWRKLSSAAALVLVALGMAGATPRAEATAEGVRADNSTHGVYIMRSLRKLARWLAGELLPLLRRSKPATLPGHG